MEEKIISQLKELDNIEILNNKILYKKNDRLIEYYLKDGRLYNIEGIVEEEFDTNYPKEFFSYDSSKYIIIFIHIFSILLKLLVGQYGYSGEHDPPKFGDYEAQRHWMELTINVPVKDWYTDSEYNPKTYWPLDYPPMSGYYSYIWGKFFDYFLPQSVELIKSYGYESLLHKILMRISVIISDLIFYHLPVYLLSRNRNDKILFNSLFLLTPLFIIIDHGHFQYNCVMHGLFLLAIFFLYRDNYALSIWSFALCINFKQMGLYYALPFPIFVIKRLLDQRKSYLWVFLNIIRCGIITVVAIAIIWLPWLINNNHNDVLTRIFPIWRGIFEDKVATFWCNLNILFKLSKIPQNILILSSLSLTLLSSLFAVVSILIHYKSSKKITNLAFFIVSLSFFLFSFHVHEKTILVPFLAFLLNYKRLLLILQQFTIVSLFSLYPLLKREDQIMPYFVLMFFSFNYTRYISKKKSFLDLLNISFIIVYHICEIYIPPPKSYPWFYPMLNSLVSFLNFSYVFLYSNYILYKSLRLNKKKYE